MYGLQVLSVWQAATAIVRTFPHPPEGLITMVDALAHQAGEPTAASFDTAAAASSVVQELADPWPSLENHIYKEKLASMPMQPRTAVAG